jgi:hypothetical protein
MQRVSSWYCVPGMFFAPSCLNFSRSRGEQERSPELLLQPSARPVELAATLTFRR